MAACIERSGAQTFLDIRDIPKGADFHAVIKREMPGCRELVALFTPWSVNRAWVRHEIGMADALNLHYVCVMYHVSLKDLDRNGGRGPIHETNLANLNEFRVYLDELRKRVESAR